MRTDWKRSATSTIGPTREGTVCVYFRFPSQSSGRPVLGDLSRGREGDSRRNAEVERNIVQKVGCPMRLGNGAPAPSETIYQAGPIVPAGRSAVKRVSRSALAAVILLVMFTVALSVSGTTGGALKKPTY